MEEPFNICLTCLSTDRSLIPLHKITTLLQEILFEELTQLLGGVCWECWSILVNFYKFKKKAKIAQDTLSKTKEDRNINPLSTLTSKTNIFYDYEYTYTLDPLDNFNTELKTEPETIKQETIDVIDDNIDDNSDFDEKKTDIDEDAGNIDDSIFLGKQEIRGQSDSAIHNGPQINEKSTDLVEKISQIPEKIVNIYVNETKHRLAKQKQKYTKCINGNKINFPQAIFNENNEKLSAEIAEKVYVETIENKSDTLKKSSKRDLEKTEKYIQEKFTQVVLSEEEMRKAREEKKNHYNFKKIPYKCDSCVLGFTRKDTFSIHMTKKHNESIGDQICDVCKIRFRHKLALNNHKSKHYIVYRCRLCKYEAHDYVYIVNHCKTKHKDDSPDRIHCSQCDVVVKTPEDLEIHMHTEHRLFCDCGTKFKDKHTLRQHINRAHSISRTFICDICKRTFNTATRLETHLATHSNFSKKLAYCQQCNIQYKNIRVYREHLQTSSRHHSQGYPCSECKKKFRSKGYLRQHFNFYHLRKSQFKCEACNKIFISNWRLHNHKQQYHGLSRPRNHSCNTCGKKFFTMATLRSHQLTHSSQRSFICAHCGDTFKQSAALYTHTRLRHNHRGTRKDDS